MTNHKVTENELDVNSISEDQVVYGCAYEMTNDERSMGLKKLPVKGKVMFCSGRGKQFYELNRKGEIKKSGAVYTWSRRYAATHEDSVDIYNTLVQRKIDYLNELIKDHEGEFISKGKS